MSGDGSGNLHPYVQVVGPFYDEQGAASVLEVTYNEVGAMIENGSLIACQLADPDRTWVLPAWQFDRFGGVVAATADVWRVLIDEGRADDLRWSAALWMCSANPDLDEMTAVDWLSEGRSVEPVLNSARTTMSQWQA
ncbi:hypothetical protein ACPXCG_03370 [Gordonia sp. DT218]|uniref:hypothetical protein n=1 Tax=Gordonia sp. DT218 TaxID=3416659 RepID=UPI003CF10AE3